MSKLSSAIAAILIIITGVVQAAEVDQFTNRFEHLADSAEIVNTKSQEFMNMALESANNEALEEGLDCQEKQLYKNMRVYFKNHIDGKLTPFVLKDETVPRRNFLRGETIYREWTVWDGYLLGKRSADTSEVALAPIIRMGDNQIGSDKIEHLFGRGYAYFTRKYLKGKSMKKVFRYGIRGEKTIFGGNKLATGVFSYADLAANFNGMRFWNHVLAKRQDIMGKQLGPYLKCDAGKWVQLKKIDFTKYFDASTDEGINCAKYASKKSAKKVRKQIQALNEADPDHTYACPMVPAKLEEMKAKYGKFSKWIINVDGNVKRKLFGL
jgi:hypothetical protein